MNTVFLGTVLSSNECIQKYKTNHSLFTIKMSTILLYTVKSEYSTVK